MPGVDLVSALAAASFVLVLAGVVQHFYDRYASNGFYKRNVRIATDNAGAIRTAVEGLKLAFETTDVSEALPDLGPLQNALAGLPGQIEASVAGGIVKASVEVMKAQLAEPPMPPGVQPMGTDAAAQKALTKSLKAAVGSDMIGPYAGILQEWAPNVYAWLQEHPDSVQWALSQPWLQGLIKKAAQMVPGQGARLETGNPFLKDLGV